MTYVALIAGLVLLAVGGEYLVRGAVTVARRLGVSPLVIGLTLVGFGTSMPELVASLKAALAGSPGIAIGNVVGSNIANILLILGVAAIITPIATTAKAFRRDGMTLIAATLVLLAACLAGTLNRLTGVLFVGLLLAYTIYSYRTERSKPLETGELHIKEAQSVAPLSSSLGRALGVTAFGLAGVIFGSMLLVDAAIELARRLAVSETLIGLTIVAVGTSLPELAASTVAAFRNQADVALGNVVGSNIFNALGITGVTAWVRPLTVPEEIMRQDAWVMLAAAVLLIAFAVSRWRIERWEGSVLLAGYGLYLYILLQHAPA
ncbi:MAG: calcium/sodium antiporter [Rhodospirillales bacterium]|nr:calcium/sodium antiporter [Rhodospirillales bacterium]